jgi:hypothetical protein
VGWRGSSTSVSRRCLLANAKCPVMAEAEMVPPARHVRDAPLNGHQIIRLLATAVTR